MDQTMNETGGANDGPASTASEIATQPDFATGDARLVLARWPSGKFENVSMESIVNVTREYPFDYATVMFGYIMPIVLVLTLITNTLVVMVLAQRHMRTPTNIVLFTMAIVDLFTLLSPSPWYFYIYTLGHHDKFLHPAIACYAHHYMTDTIPVFFHTSSIWLALLLAGQRYIYVCHPSLASTWCTVPRVRKAILVILVIAFLHQTTRFFDNKFDSLEILYKSAWQPACKNEVTDWVQSMNSYFLAYFTFRIVFVLTIPCAALITLNCLLFRALRRAETKRSELLRTKLRSIGATTDLNRHSMSVAGALGRQSSFMGGSSVLKNELPEAANSSSSQVAARRKIASPLVRPNNSRHADLARRQVDNEAADDGKEAAERGKAESRKFSMMSFRVGRRISGAGASLRHQLILRLSNSNNQPNSGTSNSAPATQLKTPSGGETGAVSDKICAQPTRSDSGDESDFRPNAPDEARSEAAARNKQQSERRRKAREQAKQRSKESNDAESCPSLSKSKMSIDMSLNCCPLHNLDHDLDYASCAACGACSFAEQQQRQRRRQQHQQVENDDQDEDQDDDDDDDDEEDEDDDEGECRHCLACDGATVASGGGGERSASQQHQPLSQCSSLIGAANTNNTNTNEEEEDEISSCGNTHNAFYSSSNYVLHEGALDGLETNSIREEEDSGASNQQSAGAERGRQLPCCCHAAAASPVQDRRAPSGRGCARSSSTRRRAATTTTRCCRECCPASRCQRKHFSSPKPSRQSEGQQADEGPRSTMLGCRASCGSNSEPCIKCNNHLMQAQDGSASCGGAAAARGSGENGSSESRTEAAKKAPASEKVRRAGMTQSNSEYYSNTPATTTTTTTTLYSTLANSVASLQQQQQPLHPPRHDEQKRSETPATYLAAAAKNRSASAASNRAAGRASGPLPLGNSSAGAAAPAPPTTAMNPTPALIISAGQPPMASLRTMDSNRTTLMLIVVVTVFLMVEVPVAVVTIFHVILNTFDAFKQVEIGPSMNYIKLFTNFFIMISYSVNFTIYCSMSKKFRETFRDLFMCGRARTQRRKRAAANLLYQQTQHSQHSQHANTYLNNTTTININNNNNNNNTVSASPNLFQSQAEPSTVGLRHQQSSNQNNLVAGASATCQANCAEKTNQQQQQPRYMALYRTMRAGGQQQECEL